MSWSDWHSKSEKTASEAHIALRAGDASAARRLFMKAAEEEAEALRHLDRSKVRTLGITAVSAVSLMYKADELQQAEKLAVQYLADPLPDFAADHVRQLLQSIWTTLSMRNAGVAFLPGQVTVAVRGGQAIVGAAPLDLIVEKVQTVQALFYRTIEYVKGLPHRRRGSPSFQIQEACRPWLFQAAPSSYQFSVAIQQPSQQDFFRTDQKPEEIADRFLTILRASAQDPTNVLPGIVPEEDYRNTFLKLARNLAPTGKNFGEIEVKAAGEVRGFVLAPENRREMNAVLRPKPKQSVAGNEPVTLRGVLRNLHLDNDWLEVLGADGAVTRVEGLGEEVDDVIGPMVNRKVLIYGLRVLTATTEKFRFVDIESEE